MSDYNLAPGRFSIISTNKHNNIYSANKRNNTRNESTKWAYNYNNKHHGYKDNLYAISIYILVLNRIETVVELISSMPKKVESLMCSCAILRVTLTYCRGQFFVSKLILWISSSTEISLPYSYGNNDIQEEEGCLGTWYRTTVSFETL